MILGILRYAQQHYFFVAEVIFHIGRAGKDGSVGRVRPSQFVSTIYIQPWLDVEQLLYNDSTDSQKWCA